MVAIETAVKLIPPQCEDTSPTPSVIYATPPPQFVASPWYNQHRSSPAQPYEQKPNHPKKGKIPNEPKNSQHLPIRQPLTSK